MGRCKFLFIALLGFAPSLAPLIYEGGAIAPGGAKNKLPQSKLPKIGNFAT